ncbi:hypothetical protein B484DRAFT_395125, partial [Ochromonadaceae sp. CCMP2298]
YACVLTITQSYLTADIAAQGDRILPNLCAINRQKQAASCLQKRFRQWVSYRKHQACSQTSRELPRQGMFRTRSTDVAPTRSGLSGSDRGSVTGPSGAGSRRFFGLFSSSTTTSNTTSTTSNTTSNTNNTNTTSNTTSNMLGSSPAGPKRSLSVGPHSVQDPSHTQSNDRAAWRRARSSVDSPTSSISPNAQAFRGEI